MSIHRRPAARRLARLATTAALGAALLLGPAGCGLFVPSQQSVTITSNDPNARIVVNGEPVGTGDVVVKLNRRDRHVVQAYASDGSQDRRRIDKELSPVAILDIIGGVVFLVPFLGLLGPGTYNLDPDTVNFYFDGIDDGAQASPTTAP